MELLVLLGSAFILGLSSSGHCLLMCGPVQSAWISHAQWQWTALYHLGRLGMYILIATVVQKLMSPIAWFLPVSNFTLIFGLGLLLGTALYLLIEYGFSRALSKFLLPLSAWAGRLPKAPKMLFFGMINGLLPCGMVWMAAGLGMASTTPWSTTLTMLTFWLATLPALLGLALVRHWLQKQFSFQTKWKFALPVLALVLGSVLVWRGITYGEQYSVAQPHQAVQACPASP